MTGTGNRGIPMRCGPVLRRGDPGKGAEAAFAACVRGRCGEDARGHPIG